MQIDSACVCIGGRPCVYLRGARPRWRAAGWPTSRLHRRSLLGAQSRTCFGFQCINFHRVEVKLDRQRWPASVSCWRAARRFEPNAGRASRFAHTARIGDGFDRRVRCPRPLTHRCYGWRSVGCRPRLALNNIAAICCVSGLAVPATGYFDTRAFAASRLPAFRRRSISIAVLALAHFIIKIFITTAIAMAISAVQSRSMATERRQKRRRSGGHPLRQLHPHRDRPPRPARLRLMAACPWADVTLASGSH